MDKYTVYISGPMTGIDGHNCPAFDKLAEQLEKIPGVQVLNPADTHRENPTWPRRKYMRRSVEQLLQADAVVYLPGWVESKGARVEAEIAAELQLIQCTAFDAEGGWLANTLKKLPEGGARG